MYPDLRTFLRNHSVYRWLAIRFAKTDTPRYMRRTIKIVSNAFKRRVTTSHPFQKLFSKGKIRMKKLLIGLAFLGSFSASAVTIEGIYTGECRGLRTKEANNVAMKILSDQKGSSLKALLTVRYSEKADYMNSLSKSAVDYELTFSPAAKVSGEITELTNGQFMVSFEPHYSIRKSKNTFLFTVKNGYLAGASVSDPDFSYECEMNLKN